MSLITKKPKSKKLSEQEIDQLIKKGGEVPPETDTARMMSKKKKSAKRVNVQLRLPQNLIDRIDGILNDRMISISRHTWFLEAIEAKIKAEEGSGTV